MLREQKLAELGYSLPPPRPSRLYEYVRPVGAWLFVSGHSPKQGGRYPQLGKVGDEVTLEEAQACARQCVVNALASVKATAGDLDRVCAVIKMVGYVASAPKFYQQPAVLDAASELLLALFGESGRHTRTAVGVAVLPNNIPVEIEFLFELAAD